MVYVSINNDSCFLYKADLESFHYYVNGNAVVTKEYNNLTEEEMEKVLLDFLKDESEVYTLSCYTWKYLNEKGINAEMLNEKLGSKSSDIYRLYCGRFGTPQVMTKEEMLHRLILDGVWCPSGRNCMLYNCGYYDEKFLFDFTWFSMTPDGYIKQLGHHGQTIYEDEYTYYNVSTMFYNIRQEVMRNGLSEDSFLGYRLWRDDSAVARLCEVHGVEMPDYLCQTESICSVLHEMCMLKGISDIQLFECLSSGIYPVGMEWTTELAVSAVACVSKKQGCRLETDGMKYGKDLYIDFSAKQPLMDSTGYASYGFMLDCEGKKEGGCSEIGAVLYGQYGSKIVRLKDYHGAEEDIPSILKEMAYDYQKYVKRRGTAAPVLVYGEMDKSFIKISLLDMNQSRLFRQVDRNFTFVDTRQFIEKVMNDTGIQSRNFRLGVVAETLGVMKKRPVHNALNDAKTLFNVLSGLLAVSGRFVL